MKGSRCPFFILLLLILFTVSCTNVRKGENNESVEFHGQEEIVKEKDTLVIDSEQTFEEATQGSIAPESMIRQLVLLDVDYLSTDGKIHRGQVLTNKKIETHIRHMFNFMLENDFVVEKVIPIVKYDWSDSLSMDDNNSSSFCYRNASYSKHATGMAIDINPRFNPLRWKKSDKPNQPEGAVLDTTVNGTLHPEHIVVKEFRRLGFRWGHTFSKYCDDHHFERNN